MAPDQIKSAPKNYRCRNLAIVATRILFVAAAVACECVSGATVSPSPSTRSGEHFEGPTRKDFGLFRGAKSFESAIIAGGSVWAERSKFGSSFRRLADVALNSSSQQEVEALIAFKAAILTDPRSALEGWRANDSDVCHWRGVECSPQSSQNVRHVVALNLRSLELSGTLPSALRKIGNLPFLQQLDLSSNSFAGSIPPEPLLNCSNLSTLNVSYNLLSGNIPFQLGDLPNLQLFDLQANNLTGEIPAALGNCSSLRILSLGMNQLSGDIPSALGTLSSLVYLDVESNSLSGSIPPSLGNCSSLTSLRISENYDVEGDIPLTLSQLTALTYFNLQACSLGGSFPTWIVNLTTLAEFSLSWNNIVGEIPEDMGKLSELNTFFVYSNNLTGVIPTSFTNITSLLYLDVGQNFITGTIPTSLDSLVNLQTLGVTDNSLTGVMPSSIGNLSALQALGVGDNLLMTAQTLPSWIGSFPNMIELFLPYMNLEGEIPVEIGNLAAVQNLALGNNNLIGSIPLSFQNCTSLSDLELDWNQLEGPIPTGLGALTQMYMLLLDNNQLTGPFPGFISNFSQLHTVDVSFNALHGDIDGSISKLSNLQIFQANENGFSGYLPGAIANCTSLTQIDIDTNNLIGEIPSSLGNLTSLQQLYLNNNQFHGGIPRLLLVGALQLGDITLSFNFLEGTIPSEIGRLIYLRSLYLVGNNFSGAVPNSLGNCSSMMELDLSSNSFDSNIPGSSIGQMSSSLQYLNLSHNHFIGSWPSQFSSLAFITTIDVSANNISGPVPYGLGKCIQLQALDVSLNSLSGEIPGDLGSLKYLTFINTSYNNFTGAIPHSGVFILSNVTRASFLGEPLLCGGNLGACNSTSAAHNSTSHGCHGFKCERIWIPTACAIIIIFTVVALGLVYSLTTKRRRKVAEMQNFFINRNSRIAEGDVARAIGLEERDRTENIIGVGAKCTVYKGIASGPGGGPFAVKLLTQYRQEEDGDTTRMPRESEILKEVHILAGLRHRNIVKCLGFFSSFGKEAIILEYVPQGSLHDHLHGQDVCDLPWDIRFKIAVGVAQGMAYLHNDCPTAIIHRDLKPRNILLDADFEPKVSDFGVSRLSGGNRRENVDGEVSASTFCGTIGYIPPEYATGTRVSTKGDVFSYGMVLLELLTLRQPANGDIDESLDLRAWVMESFREKSQELLDPALHHEGTVNPTSENQMMLLLRVAIFCTRGLPETRPTMTEVLGMLKQIRDIALEPVPNRTVTDLARERISWANEDPSDSSTPFNSASS